MRPPFDEAWEKYILPLKDKQIKTITGETNKIVDVTFKEQRII